ncbi:MlaA family lipoprotein [Polaromonas aquatica]|uniref:MlaA family lipoprotein n=1 Tax=Polaromonas aquatica TaxID=332657 RepID=UPI003D652829
MTTENTMKKMGGWVVALLALALLQGCASGPNASPADPLEPFNRTMFNFNDGLDRAVVKPVATVYRDVTPELVRTGVTNFFGNISDVWSTVNNLLQGKGQAAGESFFRVTTNTIWGVGGIFDVATDLKIPKHTEDFGQTLGVWGVGSGPYLVLPLLGPSSARDSVGTLVDYQGDLVSRTHDVPIRNSLTALRLVNIRANVLGAGDVLDQAALDKYSFTREIYLQRRRSLIGGASVEKEERYDLPEGASTAPAAPAPAAK